MLYNVNIFAFLITRAATSTSTLDMGNLTYDSDSTRLWTEIDDCKALHAVFTSAGPLFPDRGIA